MRSERRRDFSTPVTPVDRILMFLVYWLGTFCYRLVCATYRIEAEHRHIPRSLLPGPVIGACWHQRLFGVPYGMRYLRRLGFIVSQSKDGEMIRYVLEGLGFYTFQGSTSRRGGRAFLEMAAHLESGRIVGITPDGPRGPARQVQQGVVRLAVQTGTPILPTTSSASAAWFAGSWDAFLFPKPFAKVRLFFGEPIPVRKGGGQAEIQRVSRLLESRLDRLTADADRAMGIRAPRKGRTRRGPPPRTDEPTVSHRPVTTVAWSASGAPGMSAWSPMEVCEIANSCVRLNGPLPGKGAPVAGGSTDPHRDRSVMSQPRKFGRYEILHLIGKGGMGNVYKARHVDLENVVALKLLHSKFNEKPKFLERFLTEAKASGRLSHPNVVRGINAGEEGGRYFFVMEFVDGPSLDKVLAESGPIAEEKALGIVLDMAKALDHAWENKVVHRDIKPANILLNAEGRAKLADLGLATRLDTDTDRPGVSMGTAAYISPEQVQAYGDVDIRSDIYSLGITLFHFLTGELPYEGDRDAMMASHLTDPLPDPVRFTPGISRDTTRILRKMTEKRREDRYQTPAELRDDVEKLLSGENLAVQQASRSLASRRLKRKTGLTPTKIAIAVAVLFVAALIAIAAVTGGGGGSPSPRPDKPPRPPTDPGPTAPDTDDSEEEDRLAGQAIADARAHYQANPTDYAGAIRRFSAIPKAYGMRFARAVADDVAAIRQAREDACTAALRAALEEAEQKEREGLLGEAVARLETFMKTHHDGFAETDGLEKARSALAELEKRMDEAVDTLRKRAREFIEKGDFVGAKNAADRLRQADPIEYGLEASTLLREIARAKREKEQRLRERADFAELGRAKQKATEQVKSWTHTERIKETFEAVRSRVSSFKVKEAAGLEIRDLDDLAAFQAALREAKGAVGKEMTIGGRSGKIADVSKGYVHLMIGKFKAGFKLEELTPDEVVHLAELGLSQDPAAQRGFAVYLLYHGLQDKGLALLDRLGISGKERDRFRDKTGS